MRDDEGYDPLGADFIKTNSAAARRKTGSTYTPPSLVDDMVAAAARAMEPDIVVDCGCGSGRFAIACARAFPSARVIAVDNSREACAMTRENAAANGCASRVEVVESDFMDFSLAPDRGRVLWIGNPPYVRHHDIPESAKARFRRLTRDLGVGASLLSGLHAYFLAQVAANWRPGDFGVFVTSAEWLDVNYGDFMRRTLLDRLGLDSLELYDREERVFEDAMTTAVVFSFGEPSETVACSMHGACPHDVRADDLRLSSRWTRLVDQTAGVARMGSLVPLGSIAAVHRGVVTGRNRFWVRRPDELEGIPEELTVPIVSHAREIMGDCRAQTHPEELSRLIALPADLSTLHGTSADAARRIIESAARLGIDKGYVASRRKAWWSVRPPKAPAIMMTYMARRPPVFVVSRVGLPMLNVVHGIYPKADMPQDALAELTDYLNDNVDVGDGRTYCGGLTKFEPREAEAILVPRSCAAGMPA